MICFFHSLAAIAILNTVHSALYVTFPTQGTSCAVNTPCQIKWKDDGTSPSTSNMGPTGIDLVMGDASNLQAVQILQGVSNPGLATALTFTPAGNLSSTQKYAIRFVPQNNPSKPVFSTFFSITGGNGTAVALNKTLPSVSSGSPGPIIGSKAPDASSTTSASKTTSNSVQSDSSKSDAKKSSANSIRKPFTFAAGIIALPILLAGI